MKSSKIFFFFLELRNNCYKYAEFDQMECKKYS